MRRLIAVLLALTVVGLMGLSGCGGSNDTAATVTVESKGKKPAQLSPSLEARFEVADELERRAEKRGIEAETAEREGRQAEAESFYEAANRLLKQEEKVVADIEKINHEP